jgi:hypothetical protein
LLQTCVLSSGPDKSLNRRQIVAHTFQVGARRNGLSTNRIP